MEISIEGKLDLMIEDKQLDANALDSYFEICETALPYPLHSLSP